MKNSKKLIPHPPAPPAPPLAPERPGHEGKPGFPAEMIGKIMSQVKSGHTGDLPGKIAELTKRFAGGKGPSAEKIKQWINNFDLDKYRDENGIVRCPVPKEYREKLMKRIKGEH